MKKKYTVFLLILTLSVYAQEGKVKETSEKGVYFEQNGEMILVYRGSKEGKANSGYTFTYGKDGTLEVKGKASAPTFKSPNDVVIVQDAAGNRYWKLIDGTIVKTELAGEVSKSAAAKEVSVIRKEENNAVVNEVPVETVIKEVPIEVVEEKVIETPETVNALPEKEIEIEIEEADIAEEKPEEETLIPEAQFINEQDSDDVSETEQAESIAIPTPSATEEVETVPSASSIVIDENESKNVEEISTPTPQIEEAETVEIESIPSQKANSEVSVPSEEKIILEEDAPEEDKTIISTIGDDGIEEIQVIDGEVGDVSNMFEKNYEDMSRKEKKLYKKNEKKLMKQLEKELKN